MPIQVTCPGCLSRFSVSDKYAGKKGPCPKCKKEIVVPDKSQQVVIHAPETTGPKDSKGVAVLKPIKREEFTVGWKTWTVAGLGIAIVLGIAIWIRIAGTPPATWLLALGALLLAPPIAMFGYTFLRSDELAGYTGREYLVRIAICSALFATTWLLYYGLAVFFEYKTLADVSVMHMAVTMGIMAAIGAVVSLATLELEIGQSIAHYLGYFVVTFALSWISGVELAEPLAKPKARTPSSQMPVLRRPNAPLKKTPSANPASAVPKAPTTSPTETPPGTNLPSGEKKSKSNSKSVKSAP